MTNDVLKKDCCGLGFSYDPRDMWPEVSRVIGAPAMSGDAERLARVARSDDIHDATPCSAIEGLEIVGDRRAIQPRFFHPRHESGRGESIPLNETHGSIGVSDGELESEFQASDPGT